jgi:hypothetical protein
MKGGWHGGVPQLRTIIYLYFFIYYCVRLALLCHVNRDNKLG